MINMINDDLIKQTLKIREIEYNESNIEMCKSIFRLGYNEGINIKDINDCEIVEIQISHDGKTIWINTEDGCQMRIYDSKQIIIKDMRHIAVK